MKIINYLVTSVAAMILCSNVNFCYAGNPNEKSSIEEQHDRLNVLDTIKKVSTDNFIIDLSTEEDCLHLARYFKDEDVQRTFGMGTELSENEAQETLKITLSESFSLGLMKIFTIKSLENEPIGQVWFSLKSDDKNCILIDSWIGKPFWGKGITPDAVCALISQIDVPDIDVSVTFPSTDEKSKRAVLKTGEKLGAFIKDSNGEYMPQTSEKSKFYLKEKNVYRNMYFPIEGNGSQYNLKSYKNDELEFDQDFPKEICSQKIPSSISSIEYIFSKL